MARSLNKIALDDLLSVTCACGTAKIANKSFCTRCYYSLPIKLRNGLSKMMHDGYSDQYDDALEYLKAEVWDQAQRDHCQQQHAN